MSSTDFRALRVARAARTIVTDCLAIRRDESVAVVADDESDAAVVEAILHAARAVADEVTLLSMPVRATAGASAPRIVASALAGADVFIAPTTTALGFTPELQDLLKRRATRGLVLTLATRESLSSGAALADYAEVRRVTRGVAAALRDAREVRVTCANGSDFTASFAGAATHTGDSFARQPGEISGFPSGEAWTCPVLGSGQGVLVADGSAHMLGRLTEPLAVRFVDGRAVEFTGGEQATKLRDIVASIPNADNLGELSVGTNRWARFTGNITEDKKQEGAVHFALGNSVLGGTVTSEVHIDLVLLRPTVIADGRVVVDEGRIPDEIRAGSPEE